MSDETDRTRISNAAKFEFIEKDLETYRRLLRALGEAQEQEQDRNVESRKRLGIRLDSMERDVQALRNDLEAAMSSIEKLEALPGQVLKIVERKVEEIQGMIISNPDADERHHRRKEPKTSVGRWWREAKELVLTVAMVAAAISGAISGWIHASGPSPDEVKALRAGQALIQARLQVVETATTGKSGEGPSKPADARPEK